MAKLRLKDHEAERQILGRLIGRPEESARLMRVLRISMFAGKESRWTFSRIRRFWSRYGSLPGAADLRHLLAEEGAGDGKVDEYAGYWERCAADAAGGGDSAYYVDRLEVRERARRWQRLLVGDAEKPGIIELLEEDNVEEADALAAEHASLVRGEASAVDCGDWLESYEERLEQVRAMRDDPKASVGILTGVDFLDQWTSGLSPQELGLVVGGTGAGKSTFLVHLAFEAWLQFKKVFYVTIEMPRRDIEWRLHARLTSISSDRFRRAFLGNFDEDDEAAWADRVAEMRRKVAANGGSIVVADMPNSCTVADVDAQMAQVEAERAIEFDLVCVDHLSLMSPNRATKGGRLDWDSMGEVSNDLKFFARQRDLALWAAVQRKGKLTDAQKRRSDLDSIGLSYLIPQPASKVLVLDRIKDDDGDDTDEVRANLAKHREGRTGKRIVEIDYDTCTVVEVEREDGGGDEA